MLRGLGDQLARELDALGQRLHARSMPPRCPAGAPVTMVSARRRPSARPSAWCGSVIAPAAQARRPSSNAAASSADSDRAATRSSASAVSPEVEEPRRKRRAGLFERGGAIGGAGLPSPASASRTSGAVAVDEGLEHLPGLAGEARGFRALEHLRLEIGGQSVLVDDEGAQARKRPGWRRGK